MLNSLTPFLIQWAVTALSLWVASYLFKGLRFDRGSALLVAALLLGLANAVVRPLLVALTLPLTLLTNSSADPPRVTPYPDTKAALLEARQTLE